MSPSPIEIGPVTLQPFGIIAAAGAILGVAVMRKVVRERGLDVGPLEASFTWALVAGLLGAHLVHLLFYHPEELQRGPLQLLRFWDGLSSTGGMIGGAAGVLWSFRRRRIRFAPYADAFALGLAPGWAVARLGCFAVHDHPGRHTDFFLAVAFPDGPRHDLGLYEALILFALATFLFALDRRELLRGHLLSVLAIGYGGARFFLDFLRATDVAYADARYLGLTPAQYFAIAFVVIGVASMRSMFRPLHPAPSAA